MSVPCWLLAFGWGDTTAARATLSARHTTARSPRLMRSNAMLIQHTDVDGDALLCRGVARFSSSSDLLLILAVCV